MKLLVLGSSAGGGVPQWNCCCSVCVVARGAAGDHPEARSQSESRGKDDRDKSAGKGAEGVNGAKSQSSDVNGGCGVVYPRTQSSIAISCNGAEWCVFNCSPDIRQQIQIHKELHPKPEVGLRHTPIKSVVLTNADVDHIAGLLVLREKQPLVIYATPAVSKVLSDNPIFNVLDRDLVQRRPVTVGQPFQPLDGLEVEPFFVPGKVALFLEEQTQNPDGTLDTKMESENTIGLCIREKGSDRRVFYIPGCASFNEGLRQKLKGADLVLFDGTVWQDDEMPSCGLGEKTGQRMGHMSMAGANGSMTAFQTLKVKKKVFIHINNSNRVLFENSPERKQVEASGWEISYDGMEINV